MSLELISANYVDDLKEIIKTVGLERPINIVYEALGLTFKADNISVSQPTSNFSYQMEENYFLDGDNPEVLTISNKKYEVFFNIGEWGYETRIPCSHLCLGTRPQRFGSTYFAQIELSHALEDKEYIYVVKNLSNLSGAGAMSRLNNGLGNNKAQKHERRVLLNEKLRFPVVAYNKKEWLCLCKISKEHLAMPEKSSDILSDLLTSYLKWAFAVEEIVVTDK